MICITDFLTHIRLTMKLQEQMLKKICEKWQLTITEGKVIAFLYNNPQKDTAADITRAPYAFQRKCFSGSGKSDSKRIFKNVL